MPTRPSHDAAATLLRHLVMVRFKPAADDAAKAAVIAHFARMPLEMPGIAAFEHGANSSPEGKNKGLEHVFLLTFESAAARDAYLPHPAHQALSQRLRSVVDDVLVLDYLRAS